ncbi:proline--tRNA ligase [Paenibacillus contaminans]|uniref:Proline--tRNA ligase n=1 Tax=Paenibacillus contaminans TaxID=450362 RepID=A0A329MER6_9BACL|nr:proline--tRNA ligase [Paenibacillus contaminans]RAV18471.1 proline--tRNA ligase [Paenibacillus contaminans]
MRMKHALIPTLREVPGEAKVDSHRLMLKAGLARQLAAGVYTLLPLGLKALRNVQSIIREEMDAIGAQEMLMPALHPAELWQQSGRWEQYGPELMRLTDRNGSSFALGATHEEVVTSLIANEIKSYRKLPVTVYQLQTKFRDERRPRFGVLRSREFVMKDAYSFDTTWEGLDETYARMYDAYTAIFNRCGLTFRAVEADPGTIGGTDTHEFMALCAIGEDTIVSCTSCGYAANIEKAEVSPSKSIAVSTSGAVPKLLEKMHTPDVRTIEQLTRFFDCSADRIVKAVAYRVDDRVVLALVRGDYAINELKLKHALKGSDAAMLEEDEIAEAFGCKPGFIGPFGVPGVTVVADRSIRGIRDGAAGANEQDFHWTGLDAERDLPGVPFFDLRNMTESDPCPKCGEPVRFTEGIEVGHVFKLGTKYSDALNAACLTEQGSLAPIIMGCYGIGVTRTVAAIIEQHHDEHGIIWPLEAAPYFIHLICVSMNDEVQRETAEALYASLRAKGCEVLYDDRDERPGVKFKDADLLGMPVRITVGKKAAEGAVECSTRAERVHTDVPLQELDAYLSAIMKRNDSHIRTDSL